MNTLSSSIHSKLQSQELRSQEMQILTQLESFTKQVSKLETLQIIYKAQIVRIPKPKDIPSEFLKTCNSHHRNCFTALDSCKNIKTAVSDFFSTIPNPSPEIIEKKECINKKINTLEPLFKKVLPFIIAMSMSRVLEIHLSTIDAIEFSNQELFSSALFGSIQANLVQGIDGARGIPELALKWVEAEVDEINIQNYFGHTPLIMASIRPEFEKVAFALMNRGANIHIANYQGNTPLHAACKVSQLAVIDELLQRGAGINITNYLGYTALHTAYCANNRAAIDKLLRYGTNIHVANRAGGTLLHTVCQQGLLEFIDDLLQRGININTPDYQGNTPLHVACYLNKPAIIDKLLQCGANIHATNSQGETPLHMICKIIQPNLMNKLLMHGANITIQNRDGYSPLLTLLGHRSPESMSTPNVINRLIQCIKLLLDSGANINECTAKKETALIIACTRSHLSVVRQNIALYLIERGADVTLKDCFERSALYYTILQSDRNYNIILQILTHWKKSTFLNPFLFRPIFEKKFELQLFGDSTTLQEINACIDLLIENNMRLPLTPCDPQECINIFHQALSRKKFVTAAESFLDIQDQKIYDTLVVQYGYEIIATLLENAWKIRRFDDRILWPSLSPEFFIHFASHIKENSLRSFLFIVCQLLIQNSSDNTIIRSYHLGLSLIFHGGIDINYLHECTTSFKVKYLISPLLSAFALTNNYKTPFILEILKKNPTTLNKVRYYSSNQTAFIYIASNPRILSTGAISIFIHELLRQNANPDSIDENGNTALYFLFNAWKSNPNIEITPIMTLLKITDAFRQNYNGSTQFSPLITDCKSSDQFIPQLQLLFPDSSFLLANLKKFTPEQLYSHAMTQPTKILPFTINPFELLLFIRGTGSWIATLIKEIQIPYGEVLDHMQELCNKYPCSMPSIEQIMLLATYTVDDRHLLEFEDIAIPPKPKTTTVNDVSLFFNALNFTDPSRPHYSSHLASTFKDATKEKLLGAIQTFIDRVNKKTSYAGTPKTAEALNRFYQTIEDAICHIIITLRAMDPIQAEPMISVFFTEFFEANSQCAGRLYQVVVNQFLLIVCNKKMSPLEEFRISLARFREALVHQIIPARQNSVHDYNHFIRVFGKELGIFGHRQFLATAFDDPHISMKSEVLKGSESRFRNKYRSYAIIEFIMNELQTSQNTREFFKEWAKSKIQERTQERTTDQSQILFEEQFKDFLNIQEENGALIINPEKIVELLIDLNVLTCQNPQFAKDALAAIHPNTMQKKRGKEEKKEEKTCIAFTVPTSNQQKAIFTHTEKRRDFIVNDFLAFNHEQQDASISDYSYQEIASSLETVWKDRLFKKDAAILSPKILRGIIPYLNSIDFSSFLFIQTGCFLHTLDKSSSNYESLYPQYMFIGNFIFSRGIDVDFLYEYTNSSSEKIFISPLLVALFVFNNEFITTGILKKKPGHRHLNMARWIGCPDPILIIIIKKFYNTLFGKYMFEQLLDLGTDPNASGSNGQTLVHYLLAASTVKTHFLTQNLLKTINILQKNKAGQTALNLLLLTDKSEGFCKSIAWLQHLFPHSPALIDYVKTHGPQKLRIDSFTNTQIVAIARLSGENPFEFLMFIHGYSTGQGSWMNHLIETLQLSPIVVNNHIKTIADKYPASIIFSKNQEEKNNSL